MLCLVLLSVNSIDSCLNLCLFGRYFIPDVDPSRLHFGLRAAEIKSHRIKFLFVLLSELASQSELLLKFKPEESLSLRHLQILDVRRLDVRSRLLVPHFKFFTCSISSHDDSFLCNYCLKFKLVLTPVLDFLETDRLFGLLAEKHRL